MSIATKVQGLLQETAISKDPKARELHYRYNFTAEHNKAKRATTDTGQKHYTQRARMNLNRHADHVAKSGAQIPTEHKSAFDTAVKEHTALKKKHGL